MDDTPRGPMSAPQVAAILRRVAARAFQRSSSTGHWPGAFLERASRVYELAALLIEGAVSEDDVQRALETLRLHETGAESFLVRWLHITAADFIEAALLSDGQDSGGIPPAGTHQ